MIITAKTKNHVYKTLISYFMSDRHLLKFRRYAHSFKLILYLMNIYMLIGNVSSLYLIKSFCHNQWSLGTWIKVDFASLKSSANFVKLGKVHLLHTSLCFTQV